VVDTPGLAQPAVVGFKNNTGSAKPISVGRWRQYRARRRGCTAGGLEFRCFSGVQAVTLFASLILLMTLVTVLSTATDVMIMLRLPLLDPAVVAMNLVIL